jgi:SAM-dependent methyltransferase
MVRSYESLMGAAGRSVFFRPERQRVRELLSRDARPKLLVQGDEYPLFDISMNGVSFLSDQVGDLWEVGEPLDLSLVLHGDEVYRGCARVARTERGPRGTRIGLALTTGFLDLPDILRRDDEKRLERDLDEGPTALSSRVPDAYKRIVAEMVYFLQFYRKSLDEHEGRYRKSASDVSAPEDLSSRAYEAIRRPWWRLQLEAANAAVPCLQDRDVLLAAKQYTEVLVTPLLSASPFVRRAYEKPLGYPGDYQLMQWCYLNSYDGEGAFARVFHKYFVDDYQLSRGVRSRRDFVVDLMTREHYRVLRESNDDASFRVVSLGCGPAREVSDFVAQRRQWPGQIIWTLIDQEEAALSVAYQASRRELGKWQSNGHLNLLNLSFVQMLSEGIPLQGASSQDLIFSVGLFDYLRESRAQTLLTALYELLAPGGVLAVGNAIAPNDFFWAAEFLADWTLLYRSKQEMLDLAALIPPTAEVSVVMEPSHAYHFLLVRKH